jgi:hypothetical protein
MIKFNKQNNIDLREVMERVEELEEQDERDEDEAEELVTLATLLDDCRGCGGDEKWRGDWCPVTLIRDSYFQTHAEELAEDIGAVDKAAAWPANCIDWEEATSQLQQDYTSVEFDGVTYWYR